jgi:hypothetical protein
MATMLLCCVVAVWQSSTCLWSDGSLSEAEKSSSTGQILEQIGRQLGQMARLDSTIDIACDIDGPARYVSADLLQRPQEILFDGVVSGQGIFTDGGEPLSIRLTFATGQRIQCVQLTYSGVWSEPGIPQVPVLLHTPAGDSRQVGVIPPIATPTPTGLYTQQIVFSEDAQQEESGWRRLLLTINDLPASLGLVEVRVIGHDAALRSLATVANQLARQPELAGPGMLSQMAAAVRARRVAGEKRHLRHELLHSLSALIGEMSEMSVTLYIPAGDNSTDTIEARIEVSNCSPHPLEQAVVRLEVPAGWGVAPARMVVDTLPAGESIFLGATLHPGDASQQQLFAYMYGAHNGEPLFLLAEVKAEDDAVVK